MPKEKNNQTKIPLKVPIEWNIPDYIITRFASNMVIQTIENEFKILFFEINPEICLGPSDKIPDKAMANCVASVIVTADRLQGFIDILQKQLDKWSKRKIKTEKEA